MKIKIPIPGTVGRSVAFDPNSGARAEAAVAALAAQISAGLGGTIRHSNLQGLQVGDDHPQYTGNQFPETITGQWNFQTIPFIQGATLAEYIEDVVGGSFFDFLQDTSSVVWTYFDTAGELEANVPPEFVQDTVGAMLATTASVILTYNDGAGTFHADVDQAWSPTWTGDHDFTGLVTIDDLRIGNADAAFITNDPNPVMYSTNGAGSGDFNFTGHLIIQAQTSSPRDVILAAGSPTPQGILRVGDPFGTPYVWLPVNGTRLEFGAGANTQMYTDGVNFFFENTTGSLGFIGADVVRFSTSTANNIEYYVNSVLKLLLSTARGAFSVPAQLPNYVVGSLPVGALGDTAIVTDALAPAFGTAVAGSGAVTVPVFHDGAAWIVG